VPRMGLTAEKIVESAAGLADADGLDAVSLSAIALHLGVVRLGQDQRGRLGLVGLRTELGIGKESDVAGTGGIQWRDAIDRDGRITLQLTAQALDQLLQSNTHLGFSEW